MLRSTDVLTYWSDILKEAHYPLIDMSDAVCGLSDEALRAGKLPVDCEVDDNTQLVIGYAPFYKKENNARRLKHYALMYLVARTDKDGNLRPDPDVMPWIAQEFLEPYASAWVPTIGSFTDFSSAQAEAMFHNSSNWSDYLEKAESVIEKVNGMRANEIALPWPWNYHRDAAALVYKGNIPTGMTEHILDLYDVLLKDGVSDSLVDKAIQGNKASVVDFLSHELHARKIDNELAERMKIHTGQMSNRFGLGLSQRQAVHEALNLPNKKILAVQGPPGTGKTTLLQSVIASLWVNAALQKDAMPPIIVGASTNNRAVQNILDGFTNKSDDNSLVLEQRWLPSPLREYGLYFNAPQDNYHTALRYRGHNKNQPWIGIPAEIETHDYVRKAKEIYCLKAREYSANDTDSISDIVKSLHIELGIYKKRLDDAVIAMQSLRSKEDHDRILGGLKQMHPLSAQQQVLQERWGFWADALKQEIDRQQPLSKWIDPKNRFLKWLFGLSFIRPTILRHVMKLYNATCSVTLEDVESFISTIQKNLDEIKSEFRVVQKNLRFELVQNIIGIMDKTIRYRMFHLAARYWEGRWILEMDSVFDPESPKLLGGQSHDIVKRRFQRWAMIMPCFISTLHRLPSIFRYYDGENRYLKDFIDLLVIDEAGQIAPEIGAPSFALAQKTLVVGDEYQIEPVANTSEERDIKRMKRYHLDYEDHRITPLTGSSGNMMALASRASYVTLPDMGDKPALFLEEHRRCPDDLVAFCNELVYGGKLHPLSGKRPDAPLRSWHYAHVNGIPETVGKSQRNPTEAVVIAAWVARHAQQWKQHYKKPLHDIVGLITPYNPQKQCLKKELDRVLSKEDRENLTIGTVHALQGAEKPIVIFSATTEFVHGKKPFFDRKPNMLNVAVSRAQDSFVLFGDMRLFAIDPSSKTPSSVLAKYVLAMPENELADVGQSQRVEMELFNVQRLTTHAEHEDLLLRGIRAAQQSVLIVSPYLSIHRLNESLCATLSEAIQRQVHVAVVTCPDMNHESGPESALRQNFLMARDRLAQIGCRIVETGNVHNKTLAVDLDILNDGSYNWLSAVSNVTSDFHNRETSWVCRGNDIAAQIEKEWRAFGITRVLND